MAKGKNFGGFGGGMNMQAMMKQAQKMQENRHRRRSPLWRPPARRAAAW